MVTITNEAALDRVLQAVYEIDMGNWEEAFIDNDGHWNDLYLNALIIGEEIGSDYMGPAMPIGAWVIPFGDSEKRYIDLTVGPHPYADFQKMLRQWHEAEEAEEGKEDLPFAFQEFVYND